jgi:hypothetical protein
MTPDGIKQLPWDEAARLLQRFVGERCWSVLPGVRGGSRMSLDFGERVPLDRPSKNPLISDEERHFWGSHRLLIMCPWRIECPGGYFFSCYDDDDAVIYPHLNCLVGRRVSGVQVIDPFKDVLFSFDGDGKLYLYMLDADGDNSLDITVDDHELTV